MPRRTQNLDSMSRGRVRASMSKYNLFNLYKKPPINFQGKSLYQQKWASKAETRAYHGEHLPESRWKSLFKPDLHSVAQLDASLKGVEVPSTPIPLQTYATLEKRLEFALFRAMFASSVRQARQFIIGGNVQVNGVTIKHPSFALQSGDVFNVKPEKVLVAMGRNKPSLENAIRVDNKQIGIWNKYVKTAKENPKEVWDIKQSKPKTLNTLEDNTVNHKGSIRKYNEGVEKEMVNSQKKTSRETILNDVLTSALAKGSDDQVSPDIFKRYGEKNKVKCFEVYQKLADFKHHLLEQPSLQDCKTFIQTKSTDFSSDEEAKLATQVRQRLSEVLQSHLENLRVSSQGKKIPESSSFIPFTPSFAQNLSYHSKLDKDAITEDESKAEVNLPWQKGLFGRLDPSKPYFTPWEPRPFIGCFAVLPSHIEVSFSTCHAVYLRDPTARPGQSEVITPFPEPVHERAYMYYVRKGM